MEKIFWEFGGRKEGKKKKKEKGKGKEIIKREDIFSNSENYNIKTAGSRVKVESTENFSENTEIVLISSISERFLNFTKNP